MRKILLLLAFPALVFSQRLVTANGVNAQTGTTYTYLTGDFGKLVTHSNASSIAATLPQANSTTFRSGWMFDVQNIGVGTLTITPTVSTINGTATLVLTTGQGAHIVSNGTNYSAQLGKGSGAGGAGGQVDFVTVTHSTTSVHAIPAGTKAHTIFYELLTSSTTSSTFTGSFTAGQLVTMTKCQNGTGNFDYVYPTTVLNFPKPDLSPSACTSKTGYVDASGNVQADNAITGLGGQGQGYTCINGTAPETLPSSNSLKRYCSSVDNKFHTLDSSGVDIADGSGGGGGGDASTNTSTSVDGEAVLFSGAAGKTLKRSTLTGVVKSVSGVPSAVTGTATDCVLVDGTSGECGSGSTPPYTLCSSGCSTTIPASGSTILASAHGQGANALGFYFDNSNVRALVSETRNSSGDLTIVYTGTLGRVILSGLVGGGGSTNVVLSATVTLTAAQVNALVGTPQTLVAAPGAGKWNRIISVSFSYSRVATFTDPGSSDVVVKIGTANWIFPGAEFQSTITGAVSRFFVATPPLTTTATNSSAVDNAAVTMFNFGGGNYTAGTGSTLKITTLYVSETL